MTLKALLSATFCSVGLPAPKVKPLGETIWSTRSKIDVMEGRLDLKHYWKALRNQIQKMGVTLMEEKLGLVQDHWNQKSSTHTPVTAAGWPQFRIGKLFH